MVLLTINLEDMGCIMPSYAHTGKSRCNKTKLIRGSEVEKGLLVVMQDMEMDYVRLSDMGKHDIVEVIHSHHKDQSVW